MASGNLRVIVGKNVAKFRKKFNITQVELAKKMGCSSNFIALLETGNRAPSFDTLEKITRILKVKAQKLFE